MFLRQVSCLGSSFLPRRHPVLQRLGFRSSSHPQALAPPPPPLPPPPPPWLQVLQPPHPPPRPPCPRQAARRVFSSKTNTLFTPGSFAAARCSLHTSARLGMERRGGDAGPPQKRRKNLEEKTGGEHKGGATKDGGPQKEQRGPRVAGRGGKGDTRENSRDKLSEGFKDRQGSFERQHRDHREDSAHMARRQHPDPARPAEPRPHGSRPRPEFDPAQHRPRPTAPHAHNSRPRPEFDPVQHRPRPTEPRAQHFTPSPQFDQHRPRPTEPKGSKEPHVYNSKPRPEHESAHHRPPHTEPAQNPPAEHSRGEKAHPGSAAPPVSNPWKVVPPSRPPATPGHFPQLTPQQEVKPLERCWDSCSVEPQPPGDSTVFDFSVLSYNILSQQLLHDNSYLYQHCNPAVLRWEYRLPNLLAEIQKHNADILCLQEVQEDHYENQIKPALQALGYQCEYKKRTGKKPDGCAVIFKSSRLSLLSSHPVEFLRTGDALLDRDNVALLLLLRPAGASTDACICVANTHLLYNPRRGDIKLAQLAILLAEIGRLSGAGGAGAAVGPVVLCGDFNSTPFSPLYSFLTSGHLEYRGMPIGMVSGQENTSRGQRLLNPPLWSPSLGISQQCQYQSKDAAAAVPPVSPSAVEGAISELTVEDVAGKAAATLHRARIEHTLKLQSSYQHLLLPDGRPEITTCHSRTAMTVDYILYTPEPATCQSLSGGRGLQLLGRLSLVGQSELEKVNGLPNQRHSSDHLPLLARFRYRC